jgi:Tripartite tricarboxylate transporter TctB family
MFIVIGVVFFAGAYNYSMGTAARMGPGYFPRILGALMVVLGVLVSAAGLKNQAKWAVTNGIGWTWKPVVMVTIAVVLFGLLLTRAGILASIVVLVGLAGAAAHDRDYRQLAGIAAFMCVFCAGVFIWGLKLQMKLFPWS